MWIRRTIAVKYGRDDSPCFTKVSLRPHGKSSWKKISSGRDNFQENFRWKIGGEIESDYEKIAGWKVVLLDLNSPRFMLLLSRKSDAILENNNGTKAHFCKTSMIGKSMCEELLGIISLYDLNGSADTPQWSLYSNRIIHSKIFLQEIV